MKAEGTRSFDAPRALVWQVLNDPARMVRTMPGVETFEIQDDRRWRAHVKIPLGLGGLRMSIDFEKTDAREPEFARLRAKGNGVGAMLNMETQFDLSEEGSGTSMRWAADFRLAGPVASMGQRVLQPIVNQQVGNVLAALQREVEQAKVEGAGASPAPAAGASGAEEGVHPGSPQAYEPEPEGPTHSTEEP